MLSRATNWEVECEEGTGGDFRSRMHFGGPPPAPRAGQHRVGTQTVDEGTAIRVSFNAVRCTAHVTSPSALQANSCSILSESHAARQGLETCLTLVTERVQPAGRSTRLGTGQAQGLDYLVVGAQGPCACTVIGADGGFTGFKNLQKRFSYLN